MINERKLIEIGLLNDLNLVYSMSGLKTENDQVWEDLEKEFLIELQETSRLEKSKKIPLEMICLYASAFSRKEKGSDEMWDKLWKEVLEQFEGKTQLTLNSAINLANTLMNQESVVGTNVVWKKIKESITKELKLDEVTEIADLDHSFYLLAKIHDNYGEEGAKEREIEALMT